nr:MAG TPA: hypothetical protein [Caudoviricetes sp.]
MPFATTALFVCLLTFAHQLDSMIITTFGHPHAVANKNL